MAMAKVSLGVRVMMACPATLEALESAASACPALAASTVMPCT